MSFYLFKISSAPALIKQLKDVCDFDVINAEKREIRVISPSSLLNKTYARSYYQAEGESSSSANITFMQKSAWIEHLFSRAAQETHIIDAGQRSVILRQVLEELSVQDQVSARHKKYFLQKSSHKYLTRLIKMFGVADGNQHDANFQSTSNEALLLARAEYARKLKEKRMIELHDALKLLAKEPQNSKAISFFVGFDSLSQAELELLAAHAKENEIIFAVPHNWDSPEVSYAEVLADSLLEEFASRGVSSYSFNFNSGELSDSRSIEDVSHGILRSHSDLSSQTQAVQSYSYHFAQGQGAQEQLIVEQALDALEHCPADEIAIIVRKSKRNIIRIAEALEMRGESLNLDLQLRYEDSYFGTAFYKLIEFVDKIIKKEASFQDGFALFALVQEPFFKTDIAHLLFLDARAKKYRQSPKTILSLLTAGRQFRSNCETVALAEKAITYQKPADWVNLAHHMMSNFLASPHRSRIETILNTAAHHRVLSSISEIFSSSPEKHPRVSAADLLPALKGSQIIITESVSGQDRILLTEARRVIDREFNTLIWAELSSDEYGSASLEVREEGNHLYAKKMIKVRDEERPDYEVKALEEIDFYKKVSKSAAQCIVYIYKIEDEHGEHQSPALPIAEHLRREPLRSAYLAEDRLTKLAEEGVEIRYLREMKAFSQLLSHGRRDQVQTFCAPILPERGSIDGRYPLWSDEKDQSEAVDEQRFSPSALEVYAKCPYRWFISRYLPSQELYAGADQRLFGTMVHYLIESFYSRWQETQGSNEPRLMAVDKSGKLFDAQNHKVEELATRLLDELDFDEEWAKRHFHNPRLAVERSFIEEAKIAARKRIEDDMRKLPLALPDNRNSYFEYRLGLYKPVVLEGLTISGVADRVDISSSYFGSKPSVFVYDYKGSFSSKERFINQLKIQAPLYLLAVSKEKGWRPRGYFYLSYSSSGNAGEFDEKYIRHRYLHFSNAAEKNRAPFIFKPGTIGSHIQSTFVYPEHILESCMKDFRNIAPKGENDLAATLQDTKAILREAREGFSAGRIPVALKSSLGHRMLNTEFKECKYCLYKSCVVFQRVGDADEGLSPTSLIASTIIEVNDLV